MGKGAEATAGRGGGGGGRRRRGGGPRAEAEPERGARHGGHRLPPPAVLSSAVAGDWGPAAGWADGG